MAKITRQGLIGIARGLYGSFAGKSIPSIQAIGKVTVSFADNGLTTEFKPDEVTTEFKPNSITVTFE